eukprot:CAMPEP_0114539928 /NCGR_PEP_ID=MMETSP0114-20121206/498_1 /TAXON_ID=31324 /ORGANISM="Goniomonas sp, Strain m" /LENGTH=142 /DNA_ID=CAMNT_0001724061 /DNA_START=13 /DNA_END=441 /DNA_ORIENTATION=+
MSADYLLLAHGLVEGGFGLLNLLSGVMGSQVLFPGDTVPAATSRTLMAGEVWSCSIMALGLTALSAAWQPVSVRRPVVAGALLYHALLALGSVRRLSQGMITMGLDAEDPSQGVATVVTHGVFAAAFVWWLLRHRRDGLKGH